MSDMELDCLIKDLIVNKNGIRLTKDKNEAIFILHFLDSNFVLGNAAAPPDYPIVYCSDGFCSLTGESGLFCRYMAHRGPMFAIKFAIILPFCSRNAQSGNHAATLSLPLALV